MTVIIGHGYAQQENQAILLVVAKEGHNFFHIMAPKDKI